MSIDTAPPLVAFAEMRAILAEVHPRPLHQNDGAITRVPIAGFAPVALCALVIVALSATVEHAGSQPATVR